MKLTTKTDFWFNEDRMSEENAKRYMDARRWHKVRPGYWVSHDSIVQIEIVGGTPTAGLIWIISI